MPAAKGYALHELSGGTRVLTAPMPDRMSASVVLMFGVGSRFEDDRIGGMSHFIEHLLFKGTPRRPTAKDIAEAIEGVGGVMNASTDKEVTVYWARVPMDRLELAIDVLSDIVSRSQLAPSDIDRERMVILEEIKMYQDQPQDYVHSLFEQAMWPGHPLGRDIAGTAESVSAASRDDLVAYMTEHYRRNRLVVGLSGGIDPERTATLIDRGLGLPAGPTESAYAPSPPTHDAPTVVLHEKKTEQAHIVLGARGISYLDPDRYALDILNTVLGEGMSSRLFLEIREQRGLAYDVHSYSSKHRDTGYFAIYMGVDPKKAEEAVDAALEELRKVAEEDIPDTELTKAKEFTKGRLRLGLESTNAMASWLAQQLLLTGSIRTVDEVIGIIDALTAADLRKVANRVLAAPTQMAVIGPFASDAPFRKAIGA
ncbi:MAG: pitrilysin family protein [Chloroflexota bacterium]